MAGEGSQSRAQTFDKLEVPNSPITELGKLEKQK